MSIAILLACCACALALDPSLDISQYAHTSWKVRDGFTKGVITSLAQTPDGYVWLGTESGLLRFDGVRPVQWQPPAGQRLPSSLVTFLLAAHDGTLWIGTFSGLASWKDGKLRTIPELAGQSVTSILEAHEGTVWIGIYAESGGGVCYIRSGVVRCERESDKFGTGVMALYEDSKGTVWLGLRNGLLRWKPGSPQFFSIPEDSFGVTSFLEDAQGQLLFSSYAGIRRLVDGRVEPYPSSGSVYHSQITRMFRDHDGGIWVGTAEHGLVHIREQGKTDVFSNTDGLSGDYVTRFLEDREGSIWVATFDGIDRFRAYAIPTISRKQGLSSSTALSVLASKDNSVWIGTVSALNHSKSGQISLFGSRGGTRKSDGKLNGRPPISLFQDSGGRIWVTTSVEISGDLGYLQDDRFIPIRGFPGGTVRSIAEVPSGHLWLASQQSGLIHVYEGRVLQQIPWAGLGHRDFAQVLVADPSQRGLWLGFQKGGVAYFTDGAIRASYSAENGLGQGRVSDLRFGTRGALWAATATGLSRIKDGHVTTLTSTNGLPCDQVVATIEDNDHSMWLYLACGLVRITQAELDAWVTDPSRLVSTKLFESYDGVRTHSAAGGFSPLMTKSADGKIWFLPWDGVSVIDPHHLTFNKIPPPVHIEQIVADRKSYDTASDANANLRLPPLIRDLEIDYTALSLVAPEKNRFRYKLEGLDRDWHDVGNRRQAFYTNLPPRHYRFRVTSCNNSGVWNEAGTFLDFSIAPAYYQTDWFRALCAAAFVALLWGLYRARIQQLRRQERKLRDVIETIPTFAWTALPDGSVDFVNRHWQEYTGLSAERTVGSGWQVAVHAADLKRHTEKWRVSLAIGEPFENEVRFRRAANGEYRWFLSRGVPMRSPGGKIVKWYGISTDIEDRKRAEEALRSSESYLGEAQSLTHTGSCAIDGTSRETVYWSDEMFRLFGFDPQQGLPMFDQWLQRIHPEDRDKVSLASEKTFLTKVNCDLEFRIVKPDGTVKHIHGVGHPVLSATGELVQVLGTMVDVTERKRAEEARDRLRQLEADLAQINRVSTLGEMAASLAHEIKQPIAATITSANSCIEWLAHEPPNLDRARAAAGRIDKYGNRAAEIIDRIRSFYKKSPPQRELVDVNGIIEEILTLLKCEADRYSVAMRTELTAELPKIMADQVQLQQVFMNLMLNAIEAMKDLGGELTVKSKPQDGQLQFSVSDTGVGLPKEKMDQIFSAFFTTKPQGSGMGLSISRSIVESHGGRLWATTNDGRGATFHFTLPTVAETLQVPATGT